MKLEDIKINVEYHNGTWGTKEAVVTATHTPTGINFVARERSARRARDVAVEGLRKLVHIPQEVCRSPYCECAADQCAEGKLDGRAQAAEDYDSKVIEDTIRDLRQTTKEAKERAAYTWADEEKIQYLLDKAQEEAAEVIQAVSKIRRFGPHNHHPDRQETNLQELVGELEDFQAIIWALEELGYLSPKPSTTNIIKKYNTLMGN